MSSSHHSRQLTSSSLSEQSPFHQQIQQHPLAHLNGNQMLATKSRSDLSKQSPLRHTMPYHQPQQSPSSATSSTSRPKSRPRSQEQPQLQQQHHHQDPRWTEVEQRYNQKTMSSSTSMLDGPLSPLSAITLPAPRGASSPLNHSNPPQPLTPQYHQQKQVRSSSTIPKHSSSTPTTPISKQQLQLQQQYIGQQIQKQLQLHQQQVTASQQQQNRSHHNHQRPRSISTGRLLQGVGTEQDPTSVARALLHLREQRLLATTADGVRRSNSNISKSSRQPRNSASGGISNHHQQQHQGPPLSIPRSKSLMDRPTSPDNNPSSPRGPIKQTATGISSVSGPFSDFNEDEEDSLFRQTNEKMNSLILEIDEAQFFQEVEAASPQKTVAGVPPRDRLPAIVTTSGPPSSPLLSPRQLAALDRTTLELEAQTLARRVQVLEQEKVALLATVERNEMLEKEQENQAKTIGMLQEKMQNLQGEFQSQFQNMKQRREQLINDYEAKLRQGGQQTMQLEQHISQLQKQLDKAHLDLQRAKEKHQQEYATWQQEAIQREHVLERQMTQLTETNKQVENLSQTLKDARRQVSALQDELIQANEARNLHKKQEAVHQTNRTALEQQLADSLESSCQLHDELTQHQQVVQQLKSKLREAQDQQEAQRQSIEALQSQLDSIKTEHAQNLDNIKQRQEEKEKKRLDELVSDQQGQLKEYQQRLVTLQQQLTQATDRHIAEMKAKDDSLEIKAHTVAQARVEEAQRMHEEKMRVLHEELASLQSKHNELQGEQLRRQLEAESKDRDLAREYERKGSLLQGELERMHDKLDRLNRELAEKQQKLDIMVEKLTELESRNQSNLSDLERQHAEELTAKDDVIVKQRQLFMANEAKLRTDLARKEAELLRLQDGNASEELLVQQLNETRRELDQTKRALQDDESTKHRIQDLQSTLEKVQTELVSEQARHESLEGELRVEIAKLDGKLKATEATLKQKRNLIEELEDRLMNADEESSTVGRGLNIEIASLRRELNALQDQLSQEQNAKEECLVVIASLRQEKTEQQIRLDELSKLESTVEALRKMVANIEDEKISRVVELTKVRKEKEELQNSIEELENRLSQEQHVLNAEWERREKEMKNTIENYRSASDKLESSLDEQTEHQRKLQSEVEHLKDELARVSDVSTEAVELRERIADLEKAVEYHKTLAQETDSNAKMAMKRFEEQLTASAESKRECSEQLEALRRDKEELMEALEGVIHEVQSREEEIEALSTILHKRDEELEHAKLIATKALASAQDIKSRYKERGERDAGRQSELKTRIDELRDTIEYLTNENDALKRELADLTRDLDDRNFECTRLKDKLRDQLQNHSMPNGVVSPDSTAWANSKRGKKQASPTADTDYVSVDENGFLAPDPSTVKTLDQKFAKHDGQQQSQQPFVLEETMSTKTADLGEPTKWLHDFDSEDVQSRTESNDGIRSEPGLSQSRRSIERDALRKYVRKRYLKYSSAKGGQEMEG